MMKQTMFGEDISRMSLRGLFAQKHDPACREALVEHYLPHVMRAAERAARNDDERDKLYSRLCEVLLKAIDRWNETKEDRAKYRHFSSYLANMIEHYISSNWRTYLAEEERKKDIEWYTPPRKIEEVETELDQGRAVGHALMTIAKRKTRARYLAVVLARYYGQMTLDQTAEVLGVTRERVRQMEAKSLRIIRGEFGRKRMRARDYI